MMTALWIVLAFILGWSMSWIVQARRTKTIGHASVVAIPAVLLSGDGFAPSKCGTTERTVLSDPSRTTLSPSTTLAEPGRLTLGG